MITLWGVQAECTPEPETHKPRNLFPDNGQPFFIPGEDGNVRFTKGSASGLVMQPAGYEAVEH